MELAFTGQNLVCVGPGVVPPDALGFGGAPQPGLGQQLNTVANPQLTVLQYEVLQVISAPGRLQIDFQPGAPDVIVRRTVESALGAVRPAPSAIGLNVTARIDFADEGETHRLNALFDTGEIERRLGHAVERYGFRAVWHDEGSLSTLTVDPVFEADLSWQASLNRNFDTVEQARRAVDWFEAVEQVFLPMLRQLATDDVGGRQ